MLSTQPFVASDALIPPNRRTSPRLEVLDQFHGQLVSFNVPISIRDVGPGGFSTESIVPFPIGARHLFRFTSAAGLQVLIDATVKHRRATHSKDGLTSYITGFEFVQDAVRTPTDIGLLLDAMTAVLQFEEIV